jgi:hypothetical protein
MKMIPAPEIHSNPYQISWTRFAGKTSASAGTATEEDPEEDPSRSTTQANHAPFS